MNFNEYQAETAKTAIYPGKGSPIGLFYTALGLGEAGEVQGKIKKVLRDDAPSEELDPVGFLEFLYEGSITDERREQIKGELGDVLWYASQMASEAGLSLDEVAAANLSKLASRADRGVLKGSGDNR